MHKLPLAQLFKDTCDGKEYIMLPKKRLEFPFGDLMLVGPVYPSIRILADLRTTQI